MSHHSHAPWRKAVLIPFWCIQLFFVTVNIAVLALAIAVVFEWDRNNDGRLTNTIKTAGKIIAPIFIIILVTCLILTITEIILLARHKLKPKTFVIINIFKSTIFTISFIGNCIGYSNTDNRYRASALFVSGLLLLAFWIPLIYGSIIYHRSRKERKSYKQVKDPLATPLDRSYPPVPYPQQPQYQQYGDLESNRSADIGTAGISLGGKGGSYNNGRDSRFEEFRNSRADGNVSDEERVPLQGIPHVHVEMHDGHESYEMNSRRELR